MTSAPGEAGQDKPTKISFVYSNPTDPGAFEAAYPEQLALARKLPGLIRLQTSKVWPKEDGSPTPAYRLLDLYFADYAAASAAAAEAGALVGATLEHATGGVVIAFAQVLDGAQTDTRQIPVPPSLCQPISGRGTSPPPDGGRGDLRQLAYLARPVTVQQLGMDKGCG